MKRHFLLTIFLINMSSCLVVQDDPKQPDEPICSQDLLASPTFSQKNLLPPLNLNPLYLELRSSWNTESQQSVLYSLGRFRLYNTSEGIHTEILASSFEPGYQNYNCRKEMTQEQFISLIQMINDSEMCKAQVYEQNSCSLSMIAPSSLYVIDASGPLTVNLHPYAFESETSFCNYEDVDKIQNSISNLFTEIHLESDCVLVK